MTHSSLHYILMVLSTMTLFIAAFFALLYNHKYSSKGTLVFSIFIVLIVFAEVFRAIGYYNFAYGDVAVYIARILLIIASALVVHYSMLPKKEDEALNRRLF
jgi:predicted ferric reductase